LPAISKRLGHANTAITQTIYAHALQGEDAILADMTEKKMAGRNLGAKFVLTLRRVN
jgi:integrase